MKHPPSDDTPCPNCGRTDGYPENVTHYHEEDGYEPGGTVTYFACSHCAEELAARFDPPTDV
jgi:predicted RNA-binding Zn-ribbon protein involved in translation (DUF1610 family)